MPITRTVNGASNDNYNPNGQGTSVINQSESSRELEGSSMEVRPDKVTTLERDALKPRKGESVFNTDTGQVEYWNGLEWGEVGDGVGVSGYSHTGAFAGKPLSNDYVWEAGAGINYTQSDVDAELYKVFSLDNDVHLAVDNPYWTTPTPTGNTGIGLFQGANLPDGVSSLIDYDYDFDANYPASTGTGFEGSTGRIKLNDLRYGDQLRVRFDFNAIPQIAK